MTLSKKECFLVIRPKKVQNSPSINASKLLKLLEKETRTRELNLTRDLITENQSCEDTRNFCQRQYHDCAFQLNFNSFHSMHFKLIKSKSLKCFRKTVVSKETRIDHHPPRRFFRECFCMKEDEKKKRGRKLGVAASLGRRLARERCVYRVSGRSGRFRDRFRE